MTEPGVTGWPESALLMAAKREGEALEVVAGVVFGGAVFLDGAEEFAHGSLEAVGEPVAVEGGGGVALGVVEGDGLVGEAGAAGADEAVGSGDGGGVLLAEAVVGVEEEADLGVLVVDDGVGEGRGAVGLPVEAAGGGEDAVGGAGGHPAGDDIEPVDGEVLEDEVVDGLEGFKAGDPGLVPLHDDIDGGDATDEVLIDGAGDVSEVRGPAAVLVDGEVEAVVVRRVVRGCGRRGCR